MIDLRDPEDRAAAAGEYVLGTLSADDDAAVRAALTRDTALAAEVYAWQDRLLALSGQAAAAEPAPSLWARLERSLAIRPVRAAAPRSSWWQNLRLWQGVSAIAVAASVVLAVRVSIPRAEPAGARYLAVLQSPENQSTGWIVEMQVGRALHLVPVARGAAVPAGRALQFWTKPQGAAGPTSLGLVSANQAVELPLSRLPAVGAQQLFEITLEPERGSPIDRPTGPILYVGRTVAL